MIQNKRTLQITISITLSVIVLALGTASGIQAIHVFRTTLEKKMAEDSEIIGENLRILIKQVTTQYTDQGQALVRIQEILEILERKNWIGFACVLDNTGRILAHPKREFIDMQVPIGNYEGTDLLGTQAPPIRSLKDSPTPEAAQIYRTSADIIAVQWMPKMMTYLCVHQSVAPLGEKIDHLTQVMLQIGLGFVVLIAAGSWISTGKLVDRYESHIGKSEQRNRTLVQSSSPILVVDAGGVILDANPEAETLFESRALEGTSLASLWPDDSIAELRDVYGSTAASGHIERNDIDMVSAQDRSLAVDLRACGIDYGDQEATYLLVRDVAERRRAREEILEANRQLRKLDQLKTDFLNMVSHELRTPLTSIKWSAESLAELLASETNPNVEKLLGIIRDDNQRLSDLIEQLLSFSRLDAGELGPHFQTTQIAPILRGVIEEVTPITQKKRIRFETAVPPPSVNLLADGDQVRQVLVNILDNAIKYTPEGGKVDLVWRLDGKFLGIEVTDTGIGIPAEDLPHIFEKFFRADQPDARQERGTGLGLAIVKGIVDAHEGEINIQSRIGTGTTVYLRMPLGST